jgi:glycosyltransferase involved in cell wall biosynthesis
LAQACNQADLVHVQHEFIYFGGLAPWRYRWGAFASALTVPYVVTMHTRWQPSASGPAWKRKLQAVRQLAYRWSGWERYLKAGQFKKAARVFVHTPGHGQELLALGLSANQVVVMPIGIPRPSPEAQGARAKQQWGLSGPVVTLVGFLNPTKGHLLALDAWPQVSCPGATLVIAGSAFSPREQGYADLVAARAAVFPQSVKLLGYLSKPQLVDLLAATDLLLLPYSQGTASGMLARAFAQGCLVLASDIDCFREMAAACSCLALFRQGNAADLARQITGMLANPAKARPLREAALSWAREHAWENVTKTLAGIYAEVLKK